MVQGSRLRSALSSISSTAADFLTLTLLVQFMGVTTLVATALSASVGALMNFTLHRHLVFRATRTRKRRQLPKYLGVAISTMILSALGTALLTDWGGLHYLLARAATALIIFVLWTYPLTRYVFVGARNPRQSASQSVAISQALALQNPNLGGELMTIDLSIIIPAYNERERLPLALKDIMEKISKRSGAIEVIVVDDGSTDGTAAIIDEQWRDDPRLKVIRYEKNRGKGQAVKIGVMAARGEVILFTDADNSVSLSHADLLLDELRRGADVAIGSRYVKPEATTKAQPLYRVLWSRLANLFVQNMLLRGIKDTQCGFKAFRAAPAKQAFSQLTIDGWGFDLEVLTILDRMGCAIVEVPVAFHDDRRSRITPIADALGVVSDFLKVHRNLLNKRYNLSMPG